MFITVQTILRKHSLDSVIGTSSSLPLIHRFSPCLNEPFNRKNKNSVKRGTYGRGRLPVCTDTQDYGTRSLRKLRVLSSMPGIAQMQTWRSSWLRAVGRITAREAKWGKASELSRVLRKDAKRGAGVMDNGT